MNPRQKYNNITKLGRLTTPYNGTTKQEEKHPGIDIANVKGAKVPALEDGVVIGAVNGHKQGEKNFGNSVLLKDRKGNIHRYSHLNKAQVVPGQVVVRGQQVGEFGNSGAAYSKSGKGDGTNLDIRIVNAYGKYKNPTSYVNRI